MFSKLTDSARALKEKVDLEAAKQRASAQLDTGIQSAGAAWDSHWPKVERLLVEGLLSLAEEQLRDDKMLERAFTKVYEALPLAARFVLPRDRFTEFAMARREPLLLKVQGLRAERAQPTGVRS